MRENLEELLKVLEDIRSKKYPEVPSDLVKEVAYAQYENQYDHLNARNSTFTIISKFLNNLDQDN